MLTKIAYTLTALVLALALFGSMALRHAFAEKHSQTITTNQIIDEAAR